MKVSDEGFLVLEHQHLQLEKARQDLRSVGREPAPGRIVAALIFSFRVFFKYQNTKLSGNPS